MQYKSTTIAELFAKLKEITQTPINVNTEAKRNIPSRPYSENRNNRTNNDPLQRLEEFSNRRGNIYQRGNDKYPESNIDDQIQDLQH